MNKLHLFINVMIIFNMRCSDKITNQYVFKGIIGLYSKIVMQINLNLWVNTS